MHVWQASVDVIGDCFALLSRCLSPDERGRAGRFRFDRDRRRYIAARGTLRCLLGSYAGLAPTQVQFRYGPHGKPAMAPPFDALRFNIAHAEGLALYAFAIGRDLGIDVERIRPDIAYGQLAERFFSRREIEELRAVPGHLQAAAFFTAWTRKEAYLKARGDGLVVPLDQFDVSLSPGAAPTLLRSTSQPADQARWRIYDVPPIPGYAAALVVEGTVPRRYHRRLPLS